MGSLLVDAMASGGVCKLGVAEGRLAYCGIGSVGEVELGGSTV